ncbi:unnamed protein product [Acanthoscelides obtectus]|uniref:Gamma-tubulin complex component n=3 Tax=Acanthoscelides obtectus TaxID=200917 RepID=A0A9P0JVH8_ACAOB|nr:unnamed protein product [Acanthoscelides obtectus]CAK1657134.1 Gamma-tubulin complex component 4 [Acanthoscelides obtectus]
MIHECLFNLWDNLSDDISDENNWAYLFELNDFLHPGEKKLLLMIAAIAIDFHKINGFVQKVLNPALTSNDDCGTLVRCTSPQPRGMYITAFCNGIDKVLQDYRDEIVNLENTLLQNPQLPLLFILSSVERYRKLFEVLLSMINLIQKSNIRGCLLIGRMHNYICGVDQIAKAADVIIQSINPMFCRHLCNWIIYGDLVDTYEEFFIVDEKTSDENFLYPEQLADYAGSNTSLLHKKSKMHRPPPVRKFIINWKMVPVFIDTDTVETILFMGRIVWIMRNDPKKSTNETYEIKHKRDIWEGKDYEYYRRIQSLEKKTFDAIEFKMIMEECRVTLTKYLWTVMLVEGNLIDHLHLIRDFYALGRGELFQQFITVAEDHLKAETSGLATHSLNFIFLETARKIYGENDKTYTRFELLSIADDLKSNQWSRLQLNFEIDWPLHIVFHPKAMELYNKLFCFLLRLRKTQIDLHRLWAEHASRKIKMDRRVWTLRQNLMFLVNNLQYYLQVDVIEAQFSVLLKAVENANEFEDIIKVHHEFISNLLAKTFVLKPDEEHTYKHKHRLYQEPAVQCDEPSKVYSVIMSLLELCDEFCLVAGTWGTELTEPDFEDLEIFQKRSDNIIETLLFILYKFHEKVNGEHLLQLLSQLDFNSYFSKKMSDLNLMDV